MRRKSGGSELTAHAHWPFGPLIVFVAGVLAVLLSLYSYFTPLTGITGSAGALLVVGSSVAIVIDAIILWRTRGGPEFWLFWTLGMFGALGTIAAAFFLHSWWLLGANLVVLLGLVVTLTSRGPAKETAA
jgi:hypothetical protein